MRQAEAVQDPYVLGKPYPHAFIKAAKDRARLQEDSGLANAHMSDQHSQSVLEVQVPSC